MARPKAGVTAYDRFNANWERDQKTGCWNWTGTISRAYKGYGHIRIGNKAMKAHRYSWEAHRGKIPEGMHVLHSCDNSICVNPDHLWIGTHQDNMRDMFRKGRRQERRGQEHHKTHLTDADALAIYNSSDGPAALSKEYGISRQAVWNIKSKRTWKHIHKE